jgi:hypothetical protein
MRLPHRSKVDRPIVGAIVGAARSVLGHTQWGGTEEHGNGAAEGQAQKNRRLDRSLIDNRNHGACQPCPGVQTCSFAVMILPNEEFSAAPRTASESSAGSLGEIDPLARYSASNHALAVLLKNERTSSSVGMEGWAPWRVTEIAATAEANIAESLGE